MFEKAFVPLYADVGRPPKPVRLMVGLLMLKQLENLSDERVVDAQNPYYQAFCGMEHFQGKFPCEPSELVHFRKCIGEGGVEKMFQASVALHGEQALEREVVIDTTVQEKNITFPTDTTLRVKVIRRCWKVAEQENIQLRRSYSRELKKTLRVIRFSKSMRDKKKIAAAMRRVKTMVNALLRDIARKLPRILPHLHSGNTWAIVIRDMMIEVA
jgi:IS5 family transposase